ncbi:MAG: putative PEP-binding protein, partial [Candidatus Hodarchaeales archaeon]
MTKLGLPVPPGFTITTKTCLDYLKTRKFTKDLEDQIWRALESIETQSNKKLGKDLLVSVRSGTSVSMPGILETVLNIGINDANVDALRAGDKRYAYDSYCRLLNMFGTIVRNIPVQKFEEKVVRKKIKRGVKRHAELLAEDLMELAEEYKSIYREYGREFPQDPREQLIEAIIAGFEAWISPVTIAYCKKNNIPADLGVAVTVQAMVFGNLGINSATGHVFTRNPSTGKKAHFGDFLPTSQADDIFKTLRTPLKIAEMKNVFPDLAEILCDGIDRLEKRYKDMQFIEFVIEEGKLFFLQTARGMRSGVAAGKIAYDMVNEGLIDKKTAISNLLPDDIERSMYPRIKWIDPEVRSFMSESGIAYGHYFASGMPASAGAAAGKISFSIEELLSNESDKYIFVTEDITQENFKALQKAAGIITTRGSMTSTAAIVSRQEGKPCLVATEEKAGLKIIERDHDKILVSEIGQELTANDMITIDGFNGDIYYSNLPIETPSSLPETIMEILNWCDEYSNMTIRTTADCASEAEIAFKNGAKGIGLVRTEHHFLEREEEKSLIQKFALANTDQERDNYLVQLEKYQVEDLLSLFRVANGKPVSIKLADAPLQDFLPTQIELMQNIAETKYEIYRSANQEQEYIDDTRIVETARNIAILRKLESLKQQNPMLGLRGCRLGLVFPSLVRMQVRAIMKASATCLKERIDTKPEITVPLIATDKELIQIRNIIDETATKFKEKSGYNIDYKVGCIIETPRASLIAGNIAKHADYIIIGGNDLTQTTLGFSREDAEKFIPVYLEKLLYKEHPFMSIDRKGVGRLVQICASESRKV